MLNRVTEIDERDAGWWKCTMLDWDEEIFVSKSVQVEIRDDKKEGETGITLHENILKTKLMLFHFFSKTKLMLPTYYRFGKFCFFEY